MHSLCKGGGGGGLGVILEKKVTFLFNVLPKNPLFYISTVKFATMKVKKLFFFSFVLA